MMGYPAGHGFCTPIVKEKTGAELIADLDRATDSAVIIIADLINQGRETAAMNEVDVITAQIKRAIKVLINERITRADGPEKQKP